MDWLPNTSSCDGLAACDIIGILQGRSMYNVTDQILFYLDWTSLKIASLVSKGWREAVLVALNMIAKKGNPLWSAKKLSWWLSVKSHLVNDFHIPADDIHYSQCLVNSLHISTMGLRMHCGFVDPCIALDYLPYSFDGDGNEDCLRSRLVMNEKFIVARDPTTKLFKCWSRRTLSPLPITRMRYFPSVSLDEVTQVFDLSGNCFFYAAIPKDQPREGFIKLDMIKEDLIATTRFTSACIYVECPMAQTQESKVTIKHFRAVDDMILLLLSFEREDAVENCFTALRKLGQGESRDVLQSTMLCVPFGSQWFFCDKDYVVALWSYDPEANQCGFRTYSIHPPESGGKITDLRLAASFDVDSPLDVEYENGILLVFTTFSNCRQFRVMDVVKGTVLKMFLVPSFFLPNESMISMKLSRNLMFFFQKAVFPSPTGTDFYVCDMRLILKMFSTHPLVVPYIFHFNTLTSSVRHVLVDDFGILAVVENDPSKGIQVVSFLPACSHCKRVTKPDLLTKCPACKFVAYCSEECRTADWDPHHMEICSDVRPFQGASITAHMF